MRQRQKNPKRRRPGRMIRAMVFAIAPFLLQTAQAVLLVGTDGTSVSRFDSSTPGTVTTVQVTGMEPGEDLVGIDFRPRNGLLYGVGENGNLYTPSSKLIV